MEYAGICGEFGKGSLLICILCYVRSVVLCVTFGFVSFIFVFLILYLSLLRTYLLRLYITRGVVVRGDVSLRPSCRVLNGTR